MARTLPSDLARLQTLLSATGKARLAVLGKTVERHMEVARQTIEFMKNGDRAAAVGIVQSGLGKVLMDEIRKDISSLQQAQYQMLKLRSAESEASYRSTLLSTGAGHPAASCN